MRCTRNWMYYLMIQAGPVYYMLWGCFVVGCCNFCIWEDAPIFFYFEFYSSFYSLYFFQFQYHLIGILFLILCSGWSLWLRFVQRFLLELMRQEGSLGVADYFEWDNELQSPLEMGLVHMFWEANLDRRASWVLHLILNERSSCSNVLWRLSTSKRLGRPTRWERFFNWNLV